MDRAKRILITEPIMQAVMDKLSARFDVTVGRRGYYNKKENLLNELRDYDAVLCMLSNPLDREVIESAGRLRIIANNAVGYNNIDVDAAREAGIFVANTPDVLTDATADGTFALLLAVARRIPEAERALRRGEFDGWNPTGFLGMELRGKTLGIIGMGRIGTGVARRALAFGMKIAYHNRSRADDALEKELGAAYIDSVPELCRQSDIISLHCPLTAGTKHLINGEILTLMKKTAILINASRGPVVDEAALAAALKSGTIAGAGLDVYEHEPEVHPDLPALENCVLLPHITSATHETREAMGHLAADAIIGILGGKAPESIANLL
ncbi:MAG: D-glycerate dehydrogenase [Balneolaceae bacterium]|nr:MAG: D-glycerate dehydrogenase [Balneolaceae bacterium]